jgi:hypothetical protein
MASQRPVGGLQKAAHAAGTVNGTPSAFRASQRRTASLQQRLARRDQGVGGMQRQFQFRNLSGDPRLNLRVAGILKS